MQVFTTFIPLLSCSLLIVFLMMRLTQHLDLSFRSKLVLLLLTIGLSFIRIEQFSVAGYIRGVVADLSITTTLMLIVACYSFLFQRAVIHTEERVVAGFLLCGGGILLYPMSLGWGNFDPYYYGYYPTLLGTLLSALVLITLFKEFYLIMICLLAALLAYSFRILDSSNLWDYLIDPLAMLYGLSILLHDLFDHFSKEKSLDA